MVLWGITKMGKTKCFSPSSFFLIPLMAARVGVTFEGLLALYQGAYPEFASTRRCTRQVPHLVRLPSCPHPPTSRQSGVRPLTSTLHHMSPRLRYMSPSPSHRYHSPPLLGRPPRPALSGRTPSLHHTSAPLMKGSSPLLVLLVLRLPASMALAQRAGFGRCGQ